MAARLFYIPQGNWPIRIGRRPGGPLNAASTAETDPRPRRFVDITMKGVSEMAETEVKKTEARQGVETHRVRWVLGISLALAAAVLIVVLAIW